MFWRIKAQIPRCCRDHAALLTHETSAAFRGLRISGSGEPTNSVPVGKCASRVGTGSALLVDVAAVKSLLPTMRLQSASAEFQDRRRCGPL